MMKNFYDILGLGEQASATDIRRAYYREARTAHPDRMGADNERIRLINEAYETLSDPTARQRFDESWVAFQATAETDDVVLDEAIRLEAGSSIPFSQRFRQMHAQFHSTFNLSPLARKGNGDYFVMDLSFERYSVSLGDVVLGQYNNLFDYISALEATPGLLSQSVIINQRLSVPVAAELWSNLLEGKYFGQELVSLRDYLLTEIQGLERTVRSCELEFYTALNTVVQRLVDKNEVQRRILILSLEKVSQFLQESSHDNAITFHLFPLICAKRFRQLFAYGLMCYWLSPESADMHQVFKPIRGFRESRELLEVFRDMLAQRHSEGLITTVQYLKLLHSFEKDMYTVEEGEHTAVDLREAAFHGLDWVGVFLTNSDRKIIVNLFLQIGIKFQKAAKLETDASLKMADESLALQMYMTAFQMGRKLSPDIEQYALNHIIRKIDKFRYNVKGLEDILPALQHRALQLADLFPFFERCRSNINLFKSPDDRLVLMRNLLNRLVEIVDYNDAHPDAPISLDHKVTTVLYQAYEGCLKNWYEATYHEETEKKLRLDLMEQLLNEKGWSFADVESTLQSPWIMVDRDEQKWFRPTRVLPFIRDLDLTIYKALGGAEINDETGEIVFYMMSLLRTDVPSQKLVTLMDLQQIVEKNIDGGFFSLDSVDPDMPYHPFQKMRFGPTQLYETELMHSMLLTDYILKFLTTDQEVQAVYPYERRSVDDMIQHLPKHLKNVIKRYRDASQAEHKDGAMTRFWIEAEEIDVNLTEDSTTSEHKTRVGIGLLKMVVKKHQLERDIDGNMKDMANDNEGWSAYRLTEREFEDLKQGRRSIDGHAIIFIEFVYDVFFWENHQVLKEHIPVQEENGDNGEDLVVFMNALDKEADGRLLMNTKNQPAFVRCVRVMARQAGLEHRYSPEFLFAHEFTLHYEEFCFHLPEFGRLRELVRMTALVRFLNGMREANKQQLDAYERYLAKQLNKDDPFYQDIVKQAQRVKASILNAFTSWSRDASYNHFHQKWKTELARIKADIGPLSFSAYSDEVNKACDEWCRQIQRDNTWATERKIRDEVIDPKRSEMAFEMSKHKRESVRKQMIDAFAEILRTSLGSYAYERLIDNFLDGNIAELAEKLATAQKTQALNDISSQLSVTSSVELDRAIESGSYQDREKIAEQEGNYQIEKQKREARSQVQKQKRNHEKKEEGFFRIRLGVEKPPEKNDLDDECVWIPSSINHHYYTDGGRHSLFVYGGVSAYPKLNVIQGGGPFQGQPVRLQGSSGSNPPPRGNGGSGGGGSGGGNQNRKISGCQEHHIIHKSLMDHPLVKAAGFNIESRTNKIFLPVPSLAGSTAPQSAASMTAAQRAALPWQQRRAFHSGRHDSEAVERVKEKMNTAMRQGDAANWTQAQYHDKLRSIVAEERQNLRQGNVALNKHYRPWAVNSQTNAR